MQALSLVKITSMKITLSILFCLSLGLVQSQTNFETTLAKFRTEIQLPYSTPDKLPYVGEIADEIVEFMDSEEEKKPYLEWAKEYPEITEELNQLVGVESYDLNGSAQYFPYGKFKVGETTFLMVLETGFDARNMHPFQSLVLLAFDKDFTYKNIRYLVTEDNSIEYYHEEYEDLVEAFYTRSVSSKLKVENDILVITSTEVNESHLTRENSTLDEQSVNIDTYKYLPSKGDFEIQFDE